ncbi:zinc-binding dehydrogenase [Zavarzinia sp. CC-PAN008]|uniref:zinc-binding dehydrogenase n=1 Tax=Zavarzinia sp. CC-PAN008 TaxID=3243332 RepID=UPI003F74746A
MTLSLQDVSVGDPGDDEIVVRIEAAPINPSDLGLLLGPADLATLREGGAGGAPTLTFTVPEGRLPAVAGRLGQSLPVGNEGAGTVVAAGRNAKALEGRRVGMFGGAMYADYRLINVRDVIPLPEGASAADGASMFVNPLTALGFVETARREGHPAIIHTAAASNLGQMLQRICLADGVPLVNIVRSTEQAKILQDIGATHVLNSKDADFEARLVDAIVETGATVAFDAIGGGTLASQIVQAMERAAVRRMTTYSRYGSDAFKQLYIYGALDLSPTVLNRLAFGFQWSVSGWLLPPFLNKVGPEVAARLRQRVADELTTTFRSHYTKVISLAEALSPDNLRAYERKATGEKFLIDPTRG